MLLGIWGISLGMRREAERDRCRGRLAKELKDSGVV